METIEREAFGDVSTRSRKRELRQKALEADLWAGKGRKPTPSCDVHHAWSLGMNKVFTREVEKPSTKNLVKEKLR